MQITIYNFSKRSNSTKQPTSGTAISAVLKDNCSRFSPVFQISSEYAAYNYVKAFDKYYWISDVIYISNAVIEIHCTEDVLATFKTQIGASEEYILRSSNPIAYNWGQAISDTLYPTMQGYTQIKSANKNPLTQYDGFYSVGILGSDVIGEEYCLTQRGAVTYLMMTQSQLTSLINTLNNLDVTSADINPIQFIASCIYIPMDVSGYELESHQYATHYANQGFTFQFSESPFILKNGFITINSDTIDVPAHPYASTRGQYLNYEPFMKHKLFAGPFGVIDIPMEVIKSQAYDDKVQFTIYCDVATGKGFLQLGDWSRVDGQIGVPAQLAQITTGTMANNYRTAMQFASSTASAAKFNFVGAASQVASAMLSSWENQLPHVNSSGSNGSMSDITPFYLESLYLIQAFENLEDIGRIVMKRIVINTIPGFIITSDCDISIQATSEEINQVKTFLNSGFFYE